MTFSRLIFSPWIEVYDSSIVFFWLDLCIYILFFFLLFEGGYTTCTWFCPYTISADFLCVPADCDLPLLRELPTV